MLRHRHRRRRDQLLRLRPDLPGCVAVGDTLDEVKAEMREAIEFQLEGMREDGLPIPPPTSLADYVEAA